MHHPSQRKRRLLGQHFLRDKNVVDRIIETGIELAREFDIKTWLEVGPGQGAITDPILERLIERPGSTLILSEADHALAEQWKSRAANTPGLLVEPGDFLELPEPRWLPLHGSPLLVVSNLPYSAGTAIVTRLALYPLQIPAMVLMFQAEVARRLRAEPDTREWGSLSIWIQNRWDVTSLISVPPGAFLPSPKVDSEVVVLRARAQPRIEIDKKKGGNMLWEKLLKLAFAHRRKMLRSGLPPQGPWRNALVQAGVDGTKRAEALTWAEWAKLWECVAAEHDGR